MAQRSHATARGAAIWLLDKVLQDQRLMSEVAQAPILMGLPAAERARAQRLANDTLRNLERCDRVLKPFLRKRPPTPIQTILRLATCEICLGGDAHGVVNEAVGLARATKRHGALGGLVNAVLRKVAAGGVDKWQELRVPHLPKWLRQPLVEAWGAKAVAEMERVHHMRPPLDISPKTAQSLWPENVETLPTGSLRLADYGQVSQLRGFKQGDWWVQDAAAALPVRGLGDVSGKRVLDLCAAPGGKTLQLAAAGAEVTALDISEARLERVSENLSRMGLNAELVEADALTFDAPLFDAVLLDAPCSATGTIRRHPDLPHAKDGAEIGGLIELQSAMLDQAIKLVKPGGRIVFCTCSLLPDEGEVQVDDLLERHPGVQVVANAFGEAGIDPKWKSSEGGVRLRPDYWSDIGGMDGFYMACLQTPA